MPLTIAGKPVTKSTVNDQVGTVEQQRECAEHIAVLGDQCRRFLAALACAARKRMNLTRKLDDPALAERFPWDHPYRLNAEARERHLKLAEVMCCCALVRRWAWAWELWRTVPIEIRAASRAPGVWGQHPADPSLNIRIWDRGWQGETTLPAGWVIPPRVEHYLTPTDLKLLGVRA